MAVPTFSFGIGFKNGPLERLRIQNEVEVNNESFAAMIISTEKNSESKEEGEEEWWLMVKAAPRFEEGLKGFTLKGFTIKLSSGLLNLENWDTTIKKEMILTVFINNKEPEIIKVR